MNFWEKGGFSFKITQHLQGFLVIDRTVFGKLVLFVYRDVGLKSMPPGIY